MFSIPPDQHSGAHLCLKLLPHSMFLVCLDNEMSVIQILDDKVFLVVHGEKDLLHGRVTAMDEQGVASPVGWTDQVKRTPRSVLVTCGSGSVPHTFDSLHARESWDD
jgi:hypothetical protein